MLDPHLRLVNFKLPYARKRSHRTLSRHLLLDPLNCVSGPRHATQRAAR